MARVVRGSYMIATTTMIRMGFLGNKLRLYQPM